MPYLQIDHSLSLSDSDRTSVIENITSTYVREMETDSAHVAVRLQQLKRSSLALGRADPDGPLVIISADIRRGRPQSQRRSLAMAIMTYFSDQFHVPEENIKIVFTEHPGPDMMGFNRVGSEWAVEK